MKPIFVAPLIAIVLAGVGVGTYLAVASAGSGGEAVVAEPTPTPTPSPAAVTPTPTLTTAPTPTAGPTVAIPADWQTYVDPKGRFSIRVPPDWEMSPYSSEDNPQWLQLGESQKTNAHLTDGVKLSVLVEAKQPGETLESKVPENPEAPRLAVEDVTINGNGGVRAIWGSDAAVPDQITYAFEQQADWILVILYPAGPKAAEYVSTFEDMVIKSFVI